MPVFVKVNLGLLNWSGGQLVDGVPTSWLKSLSMEFRQILENLGQNSSQGIEQKL